MSTKISQTIFYVTKVNTIQLTFNIIINIPLSGDEKTSLVAQNINVGAGLLQFNKETKMNLGCYAILARISQKTGFAIGSPSLN